MGGGSNRGPLPLVSTLDFGGTYWSYKHNNNKKKEAGPAGTAVPAVSLFDGTASRESRAALPRFLSSSLTF